MNELFDRDRDDCMTWRDRHAAALEHEAAELGKALAELDNVEAVLELRRRDDLLVELRSFAGGLRAEQASMTSEASALRVNPDRPAAFPMALTTRHPRGPRRNDHHPVRAAGPAAGDNPD